MRTRVIPVLLLKNGGLVKTVRFREPKYVGDPINAVKIFNEKEVDEIVVLDISATAAKKAPELAQIEEIAGEAFMPFSYGGGITTLEQIRQILRLGAEKVVLNTAALDNPDLLRQAAEQFGSQAIVASLDVRKDWLGRYRVHRHSDGKTVKQSPVEAARQVEAAGAGELFLQSVERDGTFEGYDLALIRLISEAVSIPVVACGGAGAVEDFQKAIKEGGASAVAAGSMFVFQRPHRAVLISYPSQEVLKEKVFTQL